MLLLLVLAPWAFAAVHPLAQIWLAGGVAVVLTLWAARCLTSGLTWHKCPVLMCLCGLAILGMWQITPMPAAPLSWLSPASTNLAAHLMPQSADTAVETASAGRAGNTISLYPGETRRLVWQLVAAVALFAAVRQNFATPAALRRLAIVGTVNGVLLSLFGLLQFFGAPRNMVYWTMPALGEVFGPFINRNHFAFYVNICIGLSLGLLSRRLRSDRRGFLGAILADPLTPWLLTGSAVMLTALALSLSRGGLLALLGAVAMVGLLTRRSASTAPQLWLALPLLTCGLLIWFGLDRLEDRFGALWRGAAMSDDRWPLWSRTSVWLASFPIWGAGLGTFPFLEPVCRPPRSGIDFTYDHAHNEYLELLLEGGVLGLGLVLAAGSFLVRNCLRGWRREQSTPSGDLIVGGLIGCVAVGLHSFVDFGLHIPAVTVLLVVLAAQLSGVGDGAEHPTRAHHGGKALAVLAAAALVLVGWTVWRHFRQLDHAERYRLAARECESLPQPDALARRVSYLRAATVLAPDDAAAHLRLVDALLQRSEDHADAVPAHTVPPEAVRHALRARDLCPMWDQPHLRLAAITRGPEAAETPRTHLERAAFLAPYDGRVWYLLGLDQLQAGQPNKAWTSWRESLACSDERLDEILRQALMHESAAAVAERLFPPDPELLYRAAVRLERDRADGERRRPFLLRALQLVESAGSQDVAMLRLKGRIQLSLARHAAALETLNDLLWMAPNDAPLRLEVADLLRREGKLHDARRQLAIVVQQDPGNTEAARLLEAIVHEMATRE